MKILIIGATHGNELLGVKLYQKLLRERSDLLEHIDFLIGNPRAYAQKIRYTETDLNRSYNLDGNTYEHQRAKFVKNYIRLTEPNIVLDMHTTACKQPGCLIVGNLQGEMKQRFFRATHISHILEVQPMHDITSLGDNIVGYEVPNRDITAELLDNIKNDISRFINGTGAFSEKKCYKMTDKIYKKDVPPEIAKTFVNFQEHELGFIPIMTGQNSYKKQTDYLGFKAKRLEIC